MVGAEVGDDRHGGGLFHAHQLEGGQLQHGHMVGGHLICLIQQGRADVAPQPDGFARRPQHFCDDAGGGGLAVAAGDGDHRTGADLKKHFHLRGDVRPLPGRRQQAGMVGPQARRTEHHVSFDVFHILFAQNQLYAPFFELERNLPQLVLGLFISCGNHSSRFSQQPQQRAVGNADADDGDLLPPQVGQILCQCQTDRLQAKISSFIIDQIPPVCNKMCKKKRRPFGRL